MRREKKMMCSRTLSSSNRTSCCCVSRAGIGQQKKSSQPQRRSKPLIDAMCDCEVCCNDANHGAVAGTSPDRENASRAHLWADAHELADLRHAAAQRRAVDRRAAVAHRRGRVRRDDAREHRDRRRLARAVMAKQREDLALDEVERKVVHRDVRAEDLAQPFQPHLGGKESSARVMSRTFVCLCCVCVSFTARPLDDDGVRLTPGARAGNDKK